MEENKGIPKLGYYKCLKCDLNFFFPMLNSPETFYDQLQKFDWYYLDEKEEYEIAKNYIKKSDSILEIGCGKGAFAKTISSTDYTGLELSKSAQKKAQNNGIHVLNETIEEHGQHKKNKYSIVCSFQVLEHVSNPFSFLENAIKCLNNEGYLILSIPSEDSFIKYTVNNVLNMPPHHVTRWNDKSLNSIAIMFNLELIALKHESVSDIHLGWYSQTICLRIFQKFFNTDFGLINDSFFFKILMYISSFFSKFYESILEDKNLRPNGHSVIVVYKKKKLATIIKQN